MQAEPRGEVVGEGLGVDVAIPEDPGGELYAGGVADGIADVGTGEGVERCAEVVGVDADGGERRGVRGDLGSESGVHIDGHGGS
ncbi:hypothetical protein [Agromyces archimandritae]|uniref:Uncharacterized protein n=1 Tax=Agromyces archimandritae TaxID=2781962 RepID=A0A975FMC2_9MICO|nr:hypothetical protein [Agromyces archimandritae]QTX04544.1 hypothetical protein G127AT_14985 [Agromyces archimandritae]